MKVKYIVVLLLFLLFAQGLVIASTKSRTVDEVQQHIKGGYRYLTTGKWAMPINSPPLPVTLSAMPLLFLKDKSKFDNFTKGSQTDYIYDENETFPRNVLILARITPLIFLVVLGYFVYLWAKELYGVKAALFALFIFSFSPNLLAFGSLATADIGGVLFAFLAMYSFWKYTTNPTKKMLVIAGICFGLAQISRIISLFLIPLFILWCIIIYIKKRSLKKASSLFLALLTIFSIGLLMINLAYLFDGSFTPLIEYNKEKIKSSTFNGLYENELVNWVPIPLPKPYVIAIDYAEWNKKEEVRGYFFMGEVKQIFKSFFVTHLLIKTPIAIFVLLLLGFLYFRKVSFAELYMLLYIFLTLFYFTYFVTLYAGYRHILSIYPLLIILSSRVLKNGIPKSKIITGIIVLSALWYLTSSLLVFPHHLAYFNEFIGGPKNGYKYTVDSNLDWEQDLYLVQDYIEKSDEEILVDPACVAFTGKAAIPATSLQFQKFVCYTWLKQNFEPIDYIGYSWLVYDIRGSWEKTDNGLIFTKEG